MVALCSETRSLDVYRLNGLTKLYTLVFIYLGFAFFTTLIREIVKDIEDVNGDLKIKAKTLPIVIGRKRASKVAFFFSSILLVSLLVMLQFLKNELLFLAYSILFIVTPLLYLMFKVWKAATKKEFSQASNILKLILFFGIVSMVLFLIN
jgi:4-hydroxybenzoate polyprenyltransferase